MRFEHKTILLGVMGSIAAFRAAELASILVKEGATVHCAMSDNAAKFITPLTMQTLSRNPVQVGSRECGEAWKPQHIHLADTIDAMLVAPATAHGLGCFAHGLAPDVLTSIYLATRAPVVLAPAMNGNMLSHPAVQANIQCLKARGHAFIEPERGLLACGYEGEGKLASLERILEGLACVLV
jgi:phosphopantothenoylcysteine synthetase/decarboxylase